MPAKKRMTLEQFLKALERTTRGPKALKWRLESGKIRAPHPIADKIAHCPISGVAGPDHEYSRFGDAGNSLGMKFSVYHRIACAADCYYTGYDPRLRRRLLKALHLTEVEHG